MEKYELSFLSTTVLLVFCCCLLTGMIKNSSATAAEEEKAGFTDQSTCFAVLLKNQEYVPALTKAIDEAKSEIIMSFFLFKISGHKNGSPDLILAHLAKAVKKGIKVTVILENSGGIDPQLDADNRQTKEFLQEKGVKAFLDSPRKTTHTKLIVIDQRLIILGSHNLTQSALKYNNEISVLLDRPDLAKEARNYMLAIIKDTK